MARPTSDAGRLDLRMTPEEKRAWEQSANAGERNLTQWVRYLCNREAKRLGFLHSSKKTTRGPKKGSETP